MRRTNICHFQRGLATILCILFIFAIPTQPPNSSPTLVEPISDHEIINHHMIKNQVVNTSDVLVAVIDSGLDANHPDFEGQIVGFKDYVNNRDDMDPSDGISSYDDNGHGTMVAWIIAGSGELCDKRYQGIAPGARLLIIKVLDNRLRGQKEDIASAIDFATRNGANVICMSIGGGFFEFLRNDPVITACEKAIDNGVVVIASAGNSGPSSNTINSPAASIPVIGVGAIMPNNITAPFSSRGPVSREYSPIGNWPKPDVVALGYEVFTARGKNSLDQLPINDAWGKNYTLFSGTSAAAPQVAGLAALILEENRDLDPLEVKAIIMDGADDLGLDPQEQGMGRINITRSMEIARSNDLDIVVVTPRRLLTIPYYRVFIASTVTYNFTIQVISTYDIGKTAINIDDDIEEYIQCQDYIYVKKGYSNFTVSFRFGGLESNVEQHIAGVITLEGLPPDKREIPVDINLVSFGGRAALDRSSGIDQTKSQYFTTLMRRLEQYDVFTEDLFQLDSDYMETLDVLIISSQVENHSDSDISAIQRFAERGGTLIVAGGYFNTTSNKADFNLYDCNRILNPFGLHFNYYGIGEGIDSQHGLLYGEDYNDSIIEDELTTNVSNLYVAWGTTIHVDENSTSAKAIVLNEQDNEHAIIAKSRVGNGTVIALSSYSIIDDLVLYRSIQENADNNQFLQNLVNSIIPQGPVVYDFIIDSFDENTYVNFTVIAFNSVQCEIIVYDIESGNTVVQSVMNSSYYRFSYSFLPKSKGFYKVTFILTDALSRKRIMSSEFWVFPAIATIEVSSIIIISSII